MAIISLKSNIASLYAQRALGDVENAQSKTMERLSSGLRINSAGDDAAGLAIATSLQSKSRVFAQAIRNLNDGTSFLSVAQSAMQELSNITTRQQELAEQAANGTYSTQQRTAINTEANALTQEFNRIVSTTTFNNQQIFLQQNGTVQLQDGYGVTGSITVNTTLNLGNTWNGTFTAVSSNASGGDFADVNGDGIVDKISSTGTALMLALGNGDGTFKVSNTISTIILGGAPVITADLNNDGKTDILVGNAVLLGNGNGTFSQAATSSVVAISPASVVGDFNGDGKVDVITAFNGSSDDIVQIFAGNGNGTFQSGVTLFTSAVLPLGEGELPSLTMADIDGDGKADLVFGGKGTNATILYGNGNGTFRSQALTTGSGAAIGDFNGDGIEDIALTDSTHNTVNILLGNGDGTFKSAGSFSSLGIDPLQISVADLDKDGVLDLVVTNYNSPYSVVGIFLGNGNGTFKAAATLAETDSSSVQLADINNDGVLDVVGQISQQDYIAGTKITPFAPSLNLLTQSGAQAALPVLSTQLNSLTTQLGLIGSYQSVISFAEDNLQNEKLNYDQAYGKIMDAGVAQDAADLLRQSILEQGATAILAQANQEPAVVLQLLGGPSRVR